MLVLEIINQIQIREERILHAATLLKALGHPTRIQIVELLNKHKELSVLRIKELLQIKVEQSMLSQHLIKMKECKILVCRKDGMHVFYSLGNIKIIQLLDCVSNFENGE